MSIRETPWPQGTPCWVDMMADDAAAAADFYSALLGWTMEQTGEEFGGYLMCMKDGQVVAGIGGKPPGVQMPTVWNTYLAVDDADATVMAIAAAGGQVVMGPDDIGEPGRMAFAADPAGAVFGIWEAKAHLGATRVNESGAYVWGECMSRDYPAAQAFYASVFGCTYEDMSAEGFTYAGVHLDGRLIGGMGAIGPEQPAEVPSHWAVYFGVDDTDAAVAAAAEMGADVLMPPTDTPYGRMTVIRGPQGEAVSLIDSDDTSEG